MSTMEVSVVRWVVMEFLHLMIPVISPVIKDICWVAVPQEHVLETNHGVVQMLSV